MQDADIVHFQFSMLPMDPIQEKELFQDHKLTVKPQMLETRNSHSGIIENTAIEMNLLPDSSPYHTRKSRKVASVCALVCHLNVTAGSPLF